MGHAKTFDEKRGFCGRCVSQLECIERRLKEYTAKGVLRDERRRA